VFEKILIDRKVKLLFMQKKLAKIMRKAMKDEDVLAVMLFGSYARNEDHSDIDICLIMQHKNSNDLFLSRKRLEYLRDFPDYDIRIFQQLPLYIRVRVLKEGKIIFCKDEEVSYDLAIRESREFECFKPIYDAYLEGVLHA